jgi:hypothetical protein
VAGSGWSGSGAMPSGGGSPNRAEPATRSKPRRTPKRAKQLGVTDEAYEALLAAQGGGCAICGAKPKTRRLHVDHDHKTGKVRGLLCHRCNRGLPTWATPAWCESASLYLSVGARIDGIPWLHWSERDNRA